MPRSKSRKTSIRTATMSDLPAIARLCSGTDKKNSRTPAVIPFQARMSSTGLRERVLDACMLVAEREAAIIAAVGIDLESRAINELAFVNSAVARECFSRLLAGSERLAVSFGLQRLKVAMTPAVEKWFTRLGYVPEYATSGLPARPGKGRRNFLGRSLLRRQTRFGRQIRAVGAQLGIPEDYGRRHRLPLQYEANHLSSIGPDVFGREQFLAPRCAAAWFRLRAAAFEAGAELQPVSAFRSVGYQRDLLQKKLDKGLNMQEILKVSAAPGYSEHHTGCALDVSAPGFAPLEQEFEHSPAFAWLQKHAGTFGFRLSFPRGNRHRLAYEPWHWFYAGPT